eukprot:10633930-Ditylum_brightwellii.AAC.1
MDDDNDDIISIVSSDKLTEGEDKKQKDAASLKTVVKAEPKSSKKKKLPEGEAKKQKDAAYLKTAVKAEPKSSEKRKAPEKNNAPQKKKPKLSQNQSEDQVELGKHDHCRDTFCKTSFGKNNKLHPNCTVGRVT